MHSTHVMTNLWLGTALWHCYYCLFSSNLMLALIVYVEQCPYFFWLKLLTLYCDQHFIYYTRSYLSHFLMNLKIMKLCFIISRRNIFSRWSNFFFSELDLHLQLNFSLRRSSYLIMMQMNLLKQKELWGHYWEDIKKLKWEIKKCHCKLWLIMVITWVTMESA